MIEWMKLDTDFWHDPKFVLIIKEKGEAVAFRAVKVIALINRADGQIDLNDPMQKAWAQAELGMGDKAFTSLLKTLATYHLIIPENLEVGIVNSRRTVAEKIKRDEIREKRRMAANARWNADADAEGDASA